MEIKQYLTPLERDALAEIFNISLGGAAKLMSEMISDEILLSVPNLELITPEEMCKFSSLQQSEICSIEQKFSGGLGAGMALLLFQKESSLKIIQMMMKDYATMDDVSHFEKDALSEIGNIILTSVLSTLANLAHRDIETQIPEFFVGKYESLIQASLDRKKKKIPFYWYASITKSKD